MNQSGHNVSAIAKVDRSHLVMTLVELVPATGRVPIEVRHALAGQRRTSRRQKQLDALDQHAMVFRRAHASSHRIGKR